MRIQEVAAGSAVVSYMLYEEDLTCIVGTVI